MLDHLLDDSNIARLQEVSESLDFREFVHYASNETIEISTRHGDPLITRNLVKRENVSCVEAVAQPGTELVPRSHAQFEVFVVYEGAMDVFMNGKTFHVLAGESVYIPKYVSHSIKFTEEMPTRMICITVPHAPDLPGEMSDEFEY